MHKFVYMANQDFFKSFYACNLHTVAAWAWIEAITKMQDEILERGEPITLMDAAREFQKFMGYDEDELPLYTIKAQYYRVQSRNKRRMRNGESVQVPDDDADILAMLKNIENKLDRIVPKKVEK